MSSRGASSYQRYQAQQPARVTAHAGALDTLYDITGGWTTDLDEEGATISAHDVAEAFGAPHGSAVEIHAVNTSISDLLVRGAPPDAVEVEVSGPREGYTLSWLVQSDYPSSSGDSELEPFSIRLQGAFAEPGHEHALFDAFDHAMRSLNNYAIEHEIGMPDDEESRALLDHVGVEPGEDVNVRDYLYG